MNFISITMYMIKSCKKNFLQLLVIILRLLKDLKLDYFERSLKRVKVRVYSEICRNENDFCKNFIKYFSGLL